MQDERIDEIVYEGDWQTFETPVLKDVEEKTEPQTAVSKPKKKRGFISLITLQLVICLLLAFVVFILKTMNGKVYKTLSLWYKNQSRQTLFSNEVFEDIDLSKYFSATKDSAPATYDEI